MVATYTDFFVNQHELVDEIDLIQLGQADETEFVTISHDEAAISVVNKWPS